MNKWLDVYEFLFEVNVQKYRKPFKEGVWNIYFDRGNASKGKILTDNSVFYPTHEISRTTLDW